MQNKGAILVFTILFSLVCVYHLWFTKVTVGVRNDAEEYAQGDPAKRSYYLDSVAGEEVYSFIRGYTYNECQQREINLGLDLKGGMSVTLEISVVDVIKSLANYSQDSIFLESIELAKKYRRTSQEDFVTLFGRAFNELSPNGQLSQFFYGNPMLKGRVSFESNNEEVLKVLSEEAEDAIDNSYLVLRNRIDQFGVAQPRIQKLETSGRVLVELPGVEDPDRVSRLLETTANLEFWETYVNNQQFYSYLEKANEIVREIKAVEVDSSELADDSEKVEDALPETEDVDQAKKLKSEKAEVDTPEEEESDILADLTGESEEAQEDTGDDLSDIVEDMEAEDSLASDSAQRAMQTEKELPLLSKLIPPHNNEGLMPGPVVGWARTEDMPIINEYLQMEEVRTAFPRDVQFYWSAKPVKGNENIHQLFAIKGREGKAPLTGEVVANARAQVGQTGGGAEVTMSMNNEGAKTWARLTRENIGNYIAIVLDDRVYSAPTVRDEIRGGNSSITGNFTVNEAQDLANVLKSGKMPAPARIIQSAVVGPSLGHESINAGLNSFLIAFIVILLYMLFYYSRRAGAVADLALLANMFFLIGVLASFGAALTLPGIAGIVLTIGMSVDANVLIYERIREEILAGKGIKLAVRDGYKNAYSAIIDANVTTILTGVILFLFGTGPIKGFATTLIIGITTSLFSAIFITRLVFERVLDKQGKLTFATALTKGAFKNTKIKFVDMRKIYYSFSIILVGIGVFSLVTKGLNFGVDFTGGRQYIVRFNDEVSTNDIKKSLTDEFGSAPEAIIFGQDNQIRITTKYKHDERGAEVDQEIEKKLYNGLKPMLGDNVDIETFKDEMIQSSHKIVSTIAHELKNKAYRTVLLALLIIFLYLLIRFRKWQFGVGAIAALVHDTLVVIGIFSLLHGIMPFSLEIDQAFIAAILTVVGYSINDTVVVFDRIREFTKLYPKRDVKELYNTSLNSTLSRTFSTSISTFVVLLTIFIFGGEVIRGFIFALLVGVVIGTYSSLFIATPVAFDTLMRRMKSKNKK